jgi:hypothetical protein
MGSSIDTSLFLLILGTIGMGGWWLDKQLSSELKEAIEKTVRRIFFWGVIALGGVLAARSFTSFGSGTGALLFGSVFFLNGLLRSVKGLWTRTARLKDPVMLIYGLLLVAISSAGHTAFIRKHEANFEPLFAALEQYRLASGTYPEKLVDLTPDYVVTLPQCPMQLRSSGTFYSRSEDSYHLECMIGVSGLFPYRGWYNPNQAEWFYYD